MTGIVDRIVSDRGFAFVLGQDGQKYFVHRTQVAEGVSFDNLTLDEPVEFEARATDKGPRATNLRPTTTNGNQEGN